MDEDQQTKLSRRDVVGGAGIGMTVAAMAPTLAPAMARGQEPAGQTLQNPLDKYPKPPFQRQSQPWPGLASKMTPRPDHGEDSYKGSGRLLGRKALITGGDSGMGRAAAIAYAREGADVAINYFPTEEPDAQEVIALIRKAGRKAIALPGDLRDEAFCQQLVDSAVQQLGGLDLLVSNAGRQQSHDSILDISSDDFDATMKTNIYAPFWIIKRALPHLAPGATIIATTSEQAYDPTPDLYDYAQTKAATMNFVKSLAKQLGPKGIRVNGVAPGPIWTPLQVSGGASMEKLEKFGGQTPLKRPGQPAELASIYVQLAAEDASYANGQVYGAAGVRGSLDGAFPRNHVRIATLNVTIVPSSPYGTGHFNGAVFIAAPFIFLPEQIRMSTPESETSKRRLISSARVTGTSVFDLHGERLGHVSEVMIDKASGRVIYAVLVFGHFFSFNEKHVPLPWAALHYDTARDGYVIEIDKEALTRAPTLLPRHDTPEHGWGNVDDWFGSLHGA